MVSVNGQDFNLQLVDTAGQVISFWLNLALFIVLEMRSLLILQL